MYNIYIIYIYILYIYIFFFKYIIHIEYIYKYYRQSEEGLQLINHRKVQEGAVGVPSTSHLGNMKPYRE